MVELVEVERTFSPPRDEDWVLVIVNEAGRARAAVRVEQHHDSAVFYTDERRAGSTFERAREWAEDHYIGTVYIARKP